jgi:hypothetical protein
MEEKFNERVYVILGEVGKRKGLEPPYPIVIYFLGVASFNLLFFISTTSSQLSMTEHPGTIT